jgi:hypothetical protein
VKLVATATGDPDVIIHRRATTAGAQPGGTEVRTGTMTFRVVAPPPPAAEQPKPQEPKPEQPAAANPPPAVPAPVPPAASEPPAPAAPVAPAVAPGPGRAKLRLSLMPLPGRAHSGDYVSYLLVARNGARQAAERARVCQMLPAHVQFVRASRRLRFRGRSLCFDRRHLSAGGSVATLVYVHVDTDAPAGMARARAVARASNADRAVARAGLRVLRSPAVPQRAPVTG